MTDNTREGVEIRYVSEPGAIGAVMLDRQDSGVLSMHSTARGKVFRTSRDYGATVEDQWTVPLDTMTANANLLELSDGRLIMTIKKTAADERGRRLGAAELSLVFSADGGRSWGGEVRITEPGGCYYLMNARLIRLSTGRILLPLCYLPPQALDTELETAGWCGCWFSDDEAASWSHGAWVEGRSVGGHVAEPMVVETPRGRLAMFMRTGFGYLYRSISTNWGETWTGEEPSSLRSPCSPFCVQVDPYSGYVFAVWNNAFPAKQHQYPRSPLCLAVSRDGTSTWELVTEIENDPMSNYGYPSMCFTGDSILVVYYENKGERTFDSSRQRLKQARFLRSRLSVRHTVEERLFAGLVPDRGLSSAFERSS